MLKLLPILLILYTGLFGYEYNPKVQIELWNSLEPYFLPDDHPAKPGLDKIFKSRVSYSRDGLRDAGFFYVKQNLHTKVTVARHEKLKGYLLKLYTDKIFMFDEWKYFRQRIIGAELIRDAIKKHGYGHMFKVPKKWIYPLPVNQESPEPYPKNFILVAEDMNIVSRNENLKCWRNPLLPKEVLLALYTLVKELGLDDSLHPGNVPFRNNGTLAFIDTERYHRDPIPFEKLTPYLALELQDYWQQLVNTN